MKQTFSSFINPFERIAGMQSLSIGLIGILVAAIIGYFSRFHCDNLVHFGPASWNSWISFPVEHLLLWLLPSLLFLLGGICLSRSNIRAIDVFGTVAFAQLPLVPIFLMFCLPPFSLLRDGCVTLPDGSFMIVPLAIALLLLVVIMLVWMFNALRVSCNLRGWRLWLVYVGGIIVTNYLYHFCYQQILNLLN